MKIVPKGFRRDEDLRMKLLRKSVSLRSCKNRVIKVESNQEAIELITVLKRKQGLTKVRVSSNQTHIPKPATTPETPVKRPASDKPNGVQDQRSYCRMIADNFIRKLGIERKKIQPQKDPQGIKKKKIGNPIYIWNDLSKLQNI